VLLRDKEIAVYKVVIIDDEAIIVEGLRSVVTWETYHCKVVATACDGIDGAKVIREYNPDIVFTDIRMPSVDGLTMLSGLKSEFPSMQITVLTGFRDFTYAQEAIRLGVTRFLVKPSKMNEIDEALKTMVSNLMKQGNNGIDIAPEELHQGNSDAASSFIVRQAIAYMEEHYKEKISLSDVALKCYVSQWHLSKLLNKHANKNFYDILNGIRIIEAKKLLFDPSLRINEISEIVGYTDTAHFSRVFKKLVEISANEYRNIYCCVNSKNS
jgi:two-component system, response regulator YesN